MDREMQITTQEENRLLHLMLEMGEKLLESGAEIKRVEDTLERIGLAYGAARMNVFVITSSIIITMETTDGRLLTHTRRINFANSTDFTALEQLNELSRQCCKNSMPLDEFKRRMNGQKDPDRRRNLRSFLWWNLGRCPCFSSGWCTDLLSSGKNYRTFCK